MSDPRLSQLELHQQLLEIRAARGTLTPQDVVDVARDGAHPLHSRFEWDDQIAGDAYRRIQAAELIRSVKVVYKEAGAEDGPRKVRAWSALPADEGRNAYVPTEEILADPFSAKLLMRQCERELLAVQRKYGHLQEFAAVVARTLGSDAA